MLKIDKNIAVPSSLARTSVYPFGSMNIGDSFLLQEDVPGRSGLPVNEAKLRGASWRYGDKHGKKFTVRKTPDGIRCWRIA